MRVAGNFNGTGADVYVGLGFVPDYVHVWNLEGTQILEAYWNKQMMRAAEVVEGIQNSGAGSAITALTRGNGILPYYGGRILSSTDVGVTTYGEGIFLKLDNRDYRYNAAGSPHGVFDAVTVTIDTWTLDTAAANTGHFNGNIAGTYIGEGSPICIDGKWYTIVDLAAAAGSAANAVTLSHSVASGKIEYIGGMYSTRPMIAGETARDGFLLSNTTVNVNDAICAYEAGLYDR